jgi:outer membrane protein insertion porin family
LHAACRAGRVVQRRIVVALALLALFVLASGEGPALAAAQAPAATAPANADKPSLAVLRFRVHSSKPLDYLGESLANLMRARLEASGEVRVLPASATPDALAEKAQASDAALRSLAADVGADYVVTGSLTELAGRYSLDVQVMPAALGSSGHTLVVTAERDEELEKRVDEVADGVIANVAAATPAVVAKVEWLGADPTLDPLRDALRTRAGQPFDPASVREDLATLRQSSEIGSVSADTERGPAGVVVRFRIVPADRLLGGASNAPASEQVASVTVRGNRRIEASAILARVGTKPGSRYSGAQVARDVREVQSLGFFRNVRVFVDEGPEGLSVIFDVEESPVVRQITISGNESIDGEKIRDILTLTTGSTLDYPLLFENRERIAALYRADGYYLAEVSYAIETLSESAVSINFEVEEGGKLKLREIGFLGNEHFSSRELKQGFQTQVWHLWSIATAWFDHSGTYSEPLFIQDLRSVEKKYTDAGFLRVEVGEPSVVADKDGLVVTVSISEGQQYRVGKLDIAGDDTVDAEVLEELLALQPGEVFNRSHLTEDVARLTEFYADRGFYFANVTPLSNLSASSEVVDVTFQVRKGPLYFVRNIDVSGNTLTVDSVIRREIPIVEGQLYSQRQVMLARGRIERLGFFEEVDLRMEPTDQPEQLDMNVKVVEHPTGSFSFGAGYSSQDGIVVTGSLAQTNLFGRGYNTQFSADVGGQTTRFFLSFQDPYVFGSDFSLGATLFRSDLQFEDFQQTQTGVEVILGHQLSEDGRTRGLLRYSFSQRTLDEDQNVLAAGVILRELVSGAVTSSLAGVSVLSDTRNDRFSPTAGVSLGGTLEYSGIGFFTNFLRFEGRAQWFLGAPSWLLERSTFVVGTRIGWTLPFNSISDYDLPDVAITPTVDGNYLPLRAIDTNLKLPLSERYFLGGLGEFQLRGFEARSVGPRRAILYEEISGQGNYLPEGRQRVFIDVETGDVIPPEDVDPDDPNQEQSTICVENALTGGNGNGKCNNISDRKISDFADLSETDVIGGNKFISSTFEYRFPISDTIGLQGVAFFDTGNAFAEDEDNLFDVTNWRYGTGLGVQWFSPFGPLAVVIGFPLDPLSVEDSPVFEFSVGGQGF